MPQLRRPTLMECLKGAALIGFALPTFATLAPTPWYSPFLVCVQGSLFSVGLVLLAWVAIRIGNPCEASL